MRIGLDFDNTVVNTTNFPHIGETVSGCVETLKELVNNGHKLMLFTQREHVSYNGVEDILDIAVQWFNDNGIELFTVNENDPELTKKYYESKKPGYQFLIDDRNLGVKLDENGCVDWCWVREELTKIGAL